MTDIMERPSHVSCGAISLHDIATTFASTSYPDEVTALTTGLTAAPAPPMPCKVNAMALLIGMEGTCTVEVDMHKCVISPGTALMLIHSNHVGAVTPSPDFKARAIVCSPEFARDFLPRFSSLSPLIIRLCTDPVITPDAAHLAELDTYHQWITHVMQGAATPFRKKKLAAMLQAMLYEVLDAITSAGEDSACSSRRKEILAHFLTLVMDESLIHRDVAYYATRLNITPKHLSATVKSITGHTALHWIERTVTTEAMLLLKTTDLSVKEIAAHLNFTSQSFFGKYFRTATGLSPKAYRESLS